MEVTDIAKKFANKEASPSKIIAKSEKFLGLYQGAIQQVAGDRVATSLCTTTRISLREALFYDHPEELAKIKREETQQTQWRNMEKIWRH